MAGIGGERWVFFKTAYVCTAGGYPFFFSTMHALNIDTIEIKQRRSIEAREAQLWWLAVIIITLLALALYVVDKTETPNGWWVIPELELALNTRLTRACLILATLLICAYFRDTSRRLRAENDALICSLANYSEQLEKKNHEISRLKDLSDQLIGIMDLQSALDLVLGMAVEVIGADTASIMLREKDGDTLRITASRGISQAIVESTRVHIGDGIAGLVAQEGRGVILNSDELVNGMAQRAKRSKTIVSSAIVPIQIGDEIRGVVNIAKRRGGYCFTDEDLGVLSTLANQVSMMIQKTELLDDLRNQVDILASTLEELRQAQAELMQSEKLASIGQLAGGAAHEISNPLQVILGRTEMLLEQETDKLKTESLSAILEHTTRIANIVSNLLSFSRRSEDADFEELDINTVLNKTLSLLEPQMALDDITIVLELQEKTGRVFGNTSHLQQVFTNIILNAYQVMRNQGGTMTIRSRAKAEVMEIEFADTGPGIPQENLGRLFEPFFTTKAQGEGTGLGLSIAYGIVQAHGGTIQAHNIPGQGASFMVSLPISRARAGKDARTPRPSDSNGGNHEK